MPITTYINTETILIATDKSILKVLSEIASTNLSIPLIQEIKGASKSFWQRNKVSTYYSILWPLGNDLLAPLEECQIVNFYLPDTNTSINTFIPKEIVLAYLYGYLTSTCKQLEG